MTLPVPLSGQEPTPAKSAGLMPAVKPAVLTVGIFGAVLVLVQLISTMTGTAWMVATFGIEPRSLSGLWGILTAPLVHASWGHLWGNLIVFLIFGFLIMVGGGKQFAAVTVLVWLVSGVGVWLTSASNTITVGASGIVFGWLAYLVLRGVFNRSFWQIVLGVVLLAVWGGIFWTGIVTVVFGPDSSVSWQGHLFGAIGGGLAAFLVARADRGSRSVSSGS